jgi:TPR repeat protein
MFRPVLLALLLLPFGAAAQSADELNRQSKALLEAQDFTQAVPITLKAAEKGSAEAQYNYGVCLQQGIGGLRSDSLAHAWFLKAASQRWRDAEYKVAYNYAKGRGVGRNAQQAFYWTSRCADQGDPECMFNMVNCYLNGSGTVKNTDSMLAWATRLALITDPGHQRFSGLITSSRANLANLYLDGKILKRDAEKGYMWFLIYNENKADFSIADQQLNIDDIRHLETQLSPVQRKQAVTDAATLLGKPLKNLDRLYATDL